MNLSNLILRRRGFLTGLASLLAAPAVVRADALMPIFVWRPTFMSIRGGGLQFLTCSKSDLIGVDLGSLGLPKPISFSGSPGSWYWCYWQHPLQSLPRGRVRIPQLRGPTAA
jgi:hypothetical protein